MLGSIHDFISAALPWVAIAVAVAVTAVYSSADKDKVKKHEK